MAQVYWAWVTPISHSRPEMFIRSGELLVGACT